MLGHMGVELGRHSLSRSELEVQMWQMSSPGGLRPRSTRESYGSEKPRELRLEPCGTLAPPLGR